MKKSLQIVKTKGEEVKLLWGPIKLRDTQKVDQAILQLHEYLSLINTIKETQQFSVKTWRNCLYNHYIVPALAQYFFLQEYCAIRKEWEVLNPVCSKSFFQDKAQPYLSFIKMSVPQQSYCQVHTKRYCATAFDQYLTNFKHVQVPAVEGILYNPFTHIPLALVTLAMQCSLSKLAHVYAILLRKHRENKVILTPIAWNSSNTDLVELVYLLKKANLIDTTTTVKTATNQLALLFQRKIPNQYKLWQDAQYRAKSILRYLQ